MSCVRRLVLVVGCALASAPLHAQDMVNARLWVGAATGVGVFAAGCADCQAAQAGATGAVEVGYRLSDRLDGVATIDGWTRAGSGIRDRSTLIALGLEWMPRPGAAWRLAARVGMGRYTSSSGSDVRVSSNAPALSLGLRYPLRLGTSWAVVPGVSITQAFSGRLVLNGGTTPAHTATTTVEVGLGVRWSWQLVTGHPQ